MAERIRSATSISWFKTFETAHSKSERRAGLSHMQESGAVSLQSFETLAFGELPRA